MDCSMCMWVHSTDLSCRNISFSVAPHREILIDTKNIKRGHTDTWLFASFGLQEDLATLNRVSCTASLRPDSCQAHQRPPFPMASLTLRQHEAVSVTGTMLHVSLFLSLSTSSSPSCYHQGPWKCCDLVLEQELLLLVPSKCLGLGLSV